MASYDLISVDDVVEFLNMLIKLDQDMVNKLVFHRVRCNDDIVNHTSIPTTEDGRVGFIGLLNGMFDLNANGGSKIAAMVDSGEMNVEEFITFEREQKMMYLSRWLEQGKPDKWFIVLDRVEISSHDTGYSDAADRVLAKIAEHCDRFVWRRVDGLVDTQYFEYSGMWFLVAIAIDDAGCPYVSVSLEVKREE